MTGGVWVVATQPGQAQLIFKRMSAADFVRATRQVSLDEVRYLTRLNSPSTHQSQGNREETQDVQEL